MTKPVLGNYEYDKMSRDALKKVINGKFTWITLLGFRIFPRPYTYLEKSLAEHALYILDTAKENINA